MTLSRCIPNRVSFVCLYGESALLIITISFRTSVLAQEQLNSDQGILRWELCCAGSPSKSTLLFVKHTSGSLPAESSSLTHCFLLKEEKGQGVCWHLMNLTDQ